MKEALRDGLGRRLAYPENAVANLPEREGVDKLRHGCHRARRQEVMKQDQRVCGEHKRRSSEAVSPSKRITFSNCHSLVSSLFLKTSIDHCTVDRKVV